jgi:hypothetical protein
MAPWLLLLVVWLSLPSAVSTRVRRTTTTTPVTGRWSDSERPSLLASWLLLRRSGATASPGRRIKVFIIVGEVVAVVVAAASIVVSVAVA